MRALSYGVRELSSLHAGEHRRKYMRRGMDIEARRRKKAEWEEVFEATCELGEGCGLLLQDLLQ